MKQGFVREDGWFFRGVIRGRPAFSSPAAWHRAKVSNTFHNIKHRIKNTDIKFDLDVQYLRDIYPENGKCPVLEIDLVWNGDRRNSPSLDRIIPSMGYVKGNVMWLSDLANRMKNDATEDELIKFAEYILRNKKKNDMALQ